MERRNNSSDFACYCRQRAKRIAEADAKVERADRLMGKVRGEKIADEMMARKAADLIAKAARQYEMAGLSGNAIGAFEEAAFYYSGLGMTELAGNASRRSLEIKLPWRHEGEQR